MHYSAILIGLRETMLRPMVPVVDEDRIAAIIDWRFPIVGWFTTVDDFLPLGSVLWVSFMASTLLIGWQEGYTTHKNPGLLCDAYRHLFHAAGIVSRQQNKCFTHIPAQNRPISPSTRPRCHFTQANYNIDMYIVETWLSWHDFWHLCFQRTLQKPVTYPHRLSYETSKEEN